MKTRTRPYVICHMMPSVDGRIVPTRWKLVDPTYGEYERTARTFNADAWMIGRVSMEKYTGRPRVTTRTDGPRIPRTDFVAPHDAKSFAIALDPSGKLAWKAGAIDGEHVISVLTEQVPDAYLAFLRTRRVSYVFGGKTQLNLARVLEKLRSAFRIKTLLLEGGGKINGSFLDANLIDELSLLLAPLADGSVGTPSLFDAKGAKRVARPLRLTSFEKRSGDLLWLRYKVKR